MKRIVKTITTIVPESVEEVMEMKRNAKTQKERDEIDQAVEAELEKRDVKKT